jgi:transcriptional regulator with XRE-family HTH domain
MQIGDVIAQCRQELGMERAQLARSAGVAIDTVWKIEKGKSHGTRQTLEKIAQALHTTVPDLYRRGELVKSLAETTYMRDPLAIRLERSLTFVPSEMKERVVNAFEDWIKALFT